MGEEETKETNCIKCADCCRRFVIRIPVGKRIQEFMLAMYGRPIESVTLRMKQRCKALTADNLCGIYESRPDICREYYCEAALGEGPRTIVIEGDEVAG